jgi:AcrR family transcriptional regulator
MVSEKHRTKEHIKEEFFKIYKNKPLKEIKVSDLTKACNISRGTFYFHFPGVYALYYECEQDMIGFLESELTDVKLSTLRMDYNKHIRVLSKQIKKHVERIDRVKCFLCGSEAASFRKTWFDSIRETYTDAIKFSHITSSEKLNNLALFVAGGQVAILSNWVLSGCKEPAEDIARLTAQILFQGVFYNEL